MTSSSDISPKKKFLFTVICIAVLWILADTACYILLFKIQHSHNLFYGHVLPDDKMIEGYKYKHFHPVWGWDINKEEKDSLGARKCTEYPAKDRYKIKAFGDSYTYGAEVDENETWEYFIEQQSGWECLNYGVGGYGTDQAFLKYRDSGVKSEYVILAIMDENIGRIMTHWWGVYSKGSFTVKPRFYLNNGIINLSPSPITETSKIHNLKDKAFIDELKKQDYWYNYYLKKDAPDELRWPATYTLIRHWKFFFHYTGIFIQNKVSPSFKSESATRKYHHLYENGSEGIRIMKYIVDEFVRTALKKGEIPVILIFPRIDSVDLLAKYHKKAYQPLIDHLYKKHYHYLDLADVFLKDDYSDYYTAKTKHYSVKGNRRVAGAVVEYIQQLELNKNK